MDQRYIIYFLRTSGEINIEMFEKFHRWLNGSFICKRCGRELYTMSFGFGEAICPDCYSGERQFLYFDDSYLLNRIITLFLKHGAPKSEPPCHEPIIIEDDIQQEIESVG